MGNDEKESPALEDNPCNGAAVRRIGLAGESLTKFFLWQFCDHVASAAEGSPYDLLADCRGKILKIQVKTSHYIAHGKDGPKAFNFDLVRKNKIINPNKKITHRRPFRKDECDLFALVAYEPRRVVFIPLSSNCTKIRVDWHSFDIDQIEKISFETCLKKLSEQEILNP